MVKKNFTKKLFSEEVENYLGKMRYQRSIDNMDALDTLVDEKGKDDLVLGVQTGFDAFGTLPEELKNDPKLPTPIR